MIYLKVSSVAVAHPRCVFKVRAVVANWPGPVPDVPLKPESMNTGHVYR